MTPTRQDDYILRSEFRNMIKKMETYIEQSVEHEWIDKSDLLSELDKLPSGWIPVSEQYPEDHTSVLVHDSSGTWIAQGRASEVGQWIWDSPREFIDWMPLPPHP